MKKINLIKNPELFQGEENLKTNNNYFEGWYFKNISNEKGISFIPGININKNEQKAFIQVITNESSYFVNYDIKDFEYNHEPFYIKIGNNYFSKERISIDIEDNSNNLFIYGDIKYSDSTNIKKNKLSPNIMGPFSYLTFMECNHAILSMKSKANGLIKINNEEILFNNAISYIEKDWGCSFPKEYIWLQGNCFSDSERSFMLSIADIPFKIFNFKGMICSLIIGNEEYRFATYNKAKIINYNIFDSKVLVTLKKGNYYLDIESDFNNGFKLTAPVKGKMNKDIIESIDAKICVTLRNKEKIIFSDISTNCGLEVVTNNKVKTKRKKR